MKRRVSIVMVGMLVLAACGQRGNLTDNPVPSVVPTSPNQAATTAVPTIAQPSAAAATASPIATVANEEITVAPETVTLTPGNAPAETATTQADETETTPADETAPASASETATAATDETSTASAGAGGTATGIWDCGDQSRLEDELTIFTWADYWPDDFIAEFEEACGVRVTLNTYPSNEDLAARIRAGNSGYDLILPSDYMVDILARENRLLPLDKTELPNIANLDPSQLDAPYDPGNRYSVPFQYGVTGIAYNSSEVDTPPTSWAALFDPAQLEPYENSASMLDDEREAIGAALKYGGNSVNSTDQAELDQAAQLLSEQKPLLARYDSENVSAGLASGEIVLAHAWNGAASIAKEENDDIEWVLPQEGGVIWVDTMAIPSDAPHPYVAHVFINNVLDGVFSARITDFSYYPAPNLAAEPLISQEVRDLLFLPTEADQQRLEYIERQSNPALYGDIWTRIKSE